MSDAHDLSGESGFVVLDFVERFEVAFGGIFWITDLASSATNEIIRSIAMTGKASAHHEGGQMTDMKTIGTRVGTPIEITRSFV